MKHPFTALTKSDVQTLRRKPMFVTNRNMMTYDFTSVQINDAIEHLKVLYTTGIVRASFAAKILVLNELY